MLLGISVAVYPCVIGLLLAVPGLSRLVRLTYSLHVIGAAMYKCVSLGGLSRDQRYQNCELKP